MFCSVMSSQQTHMYKFELLLTLRRGTNTIEYEVYLSEPILFNQESDRALVLNRNWIVSYI